MNTGELESKAWQLIALARAAISKTRRKLLMQEAFDLLTRASTLRQFDLEEEVPGGELLVEEQGYRMRLCDGSGEALWVYLQTENRADAMWAASALAEACADCFEEFDLWDGAQHLARCETMSFPLLSDSAEEVSAASQQCLLDIEETLLRSKVAVARSRRLLAATAALRDRLIPQRD
jgi:hypothetical protein